MPTTQRAAEAAAPLAAAPQGSVAATTTTTSPSDSPDSPSSEKEQSSASAREDKAFLPDTRVVASEVDLQRLTPHVSSYWTFFYLLSFGSSSAASPYPLPSLLHTPKGFFQHPWVLYGLGLIAAIIAGLGMVSLDLVYGIYWSATLTRPDPTYNLIRQVSNTAAGIIALCGIGQCIGTWLFLTCCEYPSHQVSAISALTGLLSSVSAASHLLCRRLQHAYVASTLTQDASYFDLHGPGEIATRCGKSINTIRIGYGEKLGYVCWGLSTLVAALISAFVNAPEYAGVLITCIPFLIILFTILSIAGEKVGTPAQRVEGLAGSFLEQVLSSVRILQSFNMEDSLFRRLDRDILDRLEKLGIKRAAVRALEMASIYFTITCLYALGFHYGSIQVTEDGLPIGRLLSSFWGIFNVSIRSSAERGGSGVKDTSRIC